jgi:nucleotide-binding universal stress UspA family protein
VNDEHWHARKILIAFDEFDYRDDLVEAGLDLAEAEGASVVFLRIISQVDPRLSGLGPARYLASHRLADAVDDWTLSRAQDAARARNIPCELVLLAGDPAELIVGLADELDADLIVVHAETERHSPLVSFLIGDVPREVVKHAHRPVLVYRRVPGREHAGES